MLQFDEVQKFYNRKLILHIPSLQLKKGIYWLQGVNGSGKTTLLRIIAGLLPFKGEIFFNGVSFRQNPVQYRQFISWADAEPAYPSFITGAELIAFYRHVRNATLEQTDKLTSIFRVHNFISLPVKTYSSGMVKRLSLLLAFIGNPSLILLDEPWTTLDAEAVPLVLQLIKDTYENFGASFLLSSHHTIESGPLFIDKKLLVENQRIYLLT